MTHAKVAALATELTLNPSLTHFKLLSDCFQCKIENIYNERKLSVKGAKHIFSRNAKGSVFEATKRNW